MLEDRIKGRSPHNSNRYMTWEFGCTLANQLCTIRLKAPMHYSSSMRLQLSIAAFSIWGVMERLFATPLLGAMDSESVWHRFKAEYPKASKTLEDYYSQLQVKAKVSDEGRLAEWEFLSNPDSKQCISIYRDGKTTVTVLNAKLSFSLAKAKNASEFKVTSMGTAPPAQFEALAREIRNKANAVSAPFSIFESRISEFVTQKAFRLKRAYEQERLGTKLVTSNGNAWIQANQIVGVHSLSCPMTAGGFREYEFHFESLDKKSNTKRDIGRFGAIEYSGKENGVPRIERMQVWSNGPKGKMPLATTEITKLVSGPVPKEAFEPKAFGIVITPALSPIPIYYYLLIFSGACDRFLHSS